MTELRVVVDQLLAPVPGGIGRYTRELARALVDRAPDGAVVSGIVSRADDRALDRVRADLPGLRRLDVVPLARQALAVAWRYGAFARVEPGASVHATSLLAPLRRRRARVVVTIHDAVPWTHPETLTPFGARWHRAMGERARRYADAVVVPTAAVADRLEGILGLGDRVHVVGGAPSPELSLPVDAAARAAALALPERYVLAVGTLEQRKGLDALVRAMARSQAPALPLVVVGPRGWGGVDLDTIAQSAGLREDRLVALGTLDDADLAVAYSRATAFAFPSRAEGFGLPVIEAMRLGAPVVHSDDAALLEVAGGAGRAVALAPGDSFESRLAEALRAVVEDEALAASLADAGRRRARDFDWRRSADAVWAIHRAL